MSSAPSGRYQSRLLNLLARQSRQLVDQCDRTFRHLRVAAVWGAQILLYPVYAVFQTGRIAGKQLQTAVQEGLPRLQAVESAASPSESGKAELTSDKPVRQVLQVVETFSLEAVPRETLAQLKASSALATTEPSSAIALRPAQNLATQPQPEGSAILVQGVATLLDSRRLVLVTLGNQILDILTTEQQRQLYHRIVWEVSDYLRQFRLAQRRSRSQLLPPSDRVDLLPPVRLFRQLMAWVQTGPVAIAVNLFQEATLPALPAEAQPQWINRLPFAAVKLPALPKLPPSALTFLDHQIAELETRKLPPVLAELPGAVAHRGQGLMQVLRSSLQRSHSEADLQSTTETPTGTTPFETFSPLKLKALLQAAVDYFFGQQNPSLSGPSFSEQDGFPLPHGSNWSQDQRVQDRLPRTSTAGTQAAEPWLTFQDLFGDVGVVSSEATLILEPVDYPLAAGQEPKALLEGSALPNNQSSLSPLNPTSQLKGDRLKKLGALIKRFLNPFAPLPLPERPQIDSLSQQKQAASAIAFPKTKAGKLARAAAQPGTVVPQTRSATALNQTGRDRVIVTDLSPVDHDAAIPAANTNNAGQPTHQAAEPTWIETEAKTVGYVKHPLERVLGWLDRAILWVEDVLIAIGRWIQRLGRS